MFLKALYWNVWIASINPSKTADKILSGKILLGGSLYVDSEMVPDTRTALASKNNVLVLYHRRTAKTLNKFNIW